MTDRMEVAPIAEGHLSTTIESDTEKNAPTSLPIVPDPKRKRPPIPHSLATIAQWWSENDSAGWEWDYIGIGEPFCFRCGWLAPVEDDDEDSPAWSAWRRASGWLERAHLVDYWALAAQGRLDEDTIDNLIPLCHWCHRDMPMYPGDPGDREKALAWVRAGSPVGIFERQWVTDTIWYIGGLPKGAARGAKLAKMVDRSLLRAHQVLQRKPDGSLPTEEEALAALGFTPGSRPAWEREGFVEYVGTPDRFNFPEAITHTEKRRDDFDRYVSHNPMRYSTEEVERTREALDRRLVVLRAGVIPDPAHLSGHSIAALVHSLREAVSA